LRKLPAYPQRALKYLSSTAIALLIAILPCHGAQTTVDASSGTFTVKNQLGAVLSGGISGTDGDGAVIQIGYYSGATTGNNFLGTWVPLSGAGSLNTGGTVTGSSPAETFNKTSIGDTTISGGNDGKFGLQLAFVVGDAGTGNSLPGATTIPLSIRFYNASTIAGSTFFNVVSDDLWTWKTPATAPIVTITLDHAGLEWLNGAASAFMTTIPVPEPTVTGLLFAGVAGLAIRRKRGCSSAANPLRLRRHTGCVS
jgi:hypothetical protein